jgi:DNA-binding transcriptional MocR family regulator
MPTFRTFTVPQQVAEHLREGILGGRWVDTMPGRDQLAEELEVSPRSVQEALKILEKEGLLIPQGPGSPEQDRDSKGPEVGTRKARAASGPAGRRCAGPGVRLS